MTSRLFSSSPLDVAIVGAGPAGIGCAVALRECGVENLRIFDRHGVGASFERWPAQMRMITPSFHSNPFGQPDLNAVTPHTSPADYLRTEHPSGPEYARYLQALAKYYELPVEIGIDVESVEKSGDQFHLQHAGGIIQSRFVIWAAGEFFYPGNSGIVGADRCLHNSQVTDWAELPGIEHALIGGFESGIDAAVHLARAGKTAHVFSRGAPWHQDHTDPSRTLSPFTRDRLKGALLDAPGRIRFYKNADITEVAELDDAWMLFDDEGTPFEISTQPILCTGFRGGLGLVEDWFTDSEGKLAFTEEADEAPKAPGLFYSGPGLKHRGSLFCFIYKFRGRFGIIAREIAERLDLPWEKALQPWWQRGFLIEDLECCLDCRCTVEAEEEKLDEEIPTEAFSSSKIISPS